MAWEAAKRLHAGQPSDEPPRKQRGVPGNCFLSGVR